MFKLRTSDVFFKEKDNDNLESKITFEFYCKTTIPK